MTNDASELLGRQAASAETVAKCFRVAVATGHPTQWEGPLFGFLQSRTELDLQVFYGSRLGLGAEMDPESRIAIRFDMPGMLEGHAHSFVGPDADPRQALSREHARRLFDAVIIEGHVGRVERAAMDWSAHARVPALYRSDSTLIYRQPLWKRLAKRLLRPSLFRRFAAFLPLSTPAADYLRNYGVPAERIFLAPYMVDHQWYERECARWREDRAGTKADLGLAGFHKIVLAILRFEERENPIEFLRAAERLRNGRPEIGFVLVGDGTRRAEVEAFVQSAALDRLVLPGFQPISALPKFYAVSDAFIHPAREECWGLSVNEAMACRVPVVVADSIGARHDLIPTDEYGLVYPLGDAARLAEAVVSVLDSPEKSTAMAEAARRRLDAYGYDAAARAFVRAVRFACGR
jgi:glycosyltransferase involved in cell wall biosynthesis